MRPGDWRCPRCGFHCFAKKNTCYQCGASKEGTEDRAVVDGSGVAASSLTDGVGAGDEAGREGDEGGAGVGGSGAGIAATPPVTSAAALQSRIPNQKGQAAAAHVLRALHCGPRNNGKYDALYSLTPEWHAQLASFLGLNDSFPSSQLVTRSTTGKAIFFIGTSVLKLLSADAASKFKLVNTGTRVFEKIEAREDIPFPFRLCQEGAACLAQHMNSSRQRVFMPTVDLLGVLQRRSMPISHLKSETLRNALLAASPGAVVLVHDAEGIGQIPYGKPMPLVLAAMRSSGANPHVELVVKASEAMSLYNRTANRPAAALETAGVELEKLEAGVQLEKLEAVGGP